MSKNILVTNGRSPAGLDLARSFSAEGHKVFVAESFSIHLCTFSRFAKSIKVPSPRLEPVAYIEALKQIIKEYSIDFLFPVYEEIFTISRFRDELDGLCKVLCGDFQLLDNLHNKLEFIAMCKKFNLSHPESTLLHKPDETIDYSSKILKPVYSRFGTDVYLKPNLKTVAKLNFNKPWVLQEYIEGKAYCAYAFCDKGKILAYSIYPVEATLMGVCISFENEDVPEILEWMTVFIDKSSSTGSISFDFILKGSTAYPIECNPRVTSGIHLLLPEPQFLDSILNKTQNNQVLKKPAIVSLFALSKALIKWSYFKKIFCRRDLLFQWNDPFPLLGQFCSISHYLYLSLKTRKSISEASTIDIEYNGPSS